MTIPTDAGTWNERYTEGNAPWDTGLPDPHLTALVGSGRIRPCRAVEMGSGTGSCAIWLAQCGFEVTAFDLSEHAIGLARERAAAAGVDVDFRVGSFEQLQGDAPFAFAHDQGVLHVFDEDDDRAAFATSAAGLLEPGGLWLNVAGSTDGPPREHGPPRRSASDLVAAVEPHFEVLSMTGTMYAAMLPTPARAWVSLLRRR